MLALAQCASFQNGEKDWHNELTHELKVLGARNWIVIAEPSFSSLSGQGAKTIVTDEPGTEVLKHVLVTLDELSFTNPVIYTPLEMNYVGEDYAPGMKSYRKEIKNILLGHNTQEAQHETLRRLMLDAAKNYNVLIIKTTTALPFSNIYMELDSGYWSSDSESVLREKMESQKPKPAKTSEESGNIPASANSGKSAQDEKQNIILDNTLHQGDAAI